MDKLKRYECTDCHLGESVHPCIAPFEDEEDPPTECPYGNGLACEWKLVERPVQGEGEAIKDSISLFKELRDDWIGKLCQPSELEEMSDNINAVITKLENIIATPCKEGETEKPCENDNCPAYSEDYDYNCCYFIDCEKRVAP